MTRQVPLGLSVTVATRPVADGLKYWYLAWEDKKPCLELFTEWEDVDYRIYALNQLRALATDFELVRDTYTFTHTHTHIPPPPPPPSTMPKTVVSSSLPLPTIDSHPALPSPPPVKDITDFIRVQSVVGRRKTRASHPHHSHRVRAFPPAPDTRLCCGCRARWRR